MKMEKGESSNKVAEIIRIDECRSTNSYCLERVDGLADRTALIAERQSAGRGRFNRKWNSENCGNLYLSVVLKPQAGANSAQLRNITQFAAYAAGKSIESYGVAVEIKWPNDLLVNGAKICGVLCETALSSGKIKAVVCGVGVNLNMSADELSAIDKPAASLNRLLAQAVDKEDFIKRYLDAFFAGYDDFLEKGFEYIKGYYIKRSSFLGKVISIAYPQKTVRVKAIRYAEDGALVIENGGCEETIYTGDVI